MTRSRQTADWGSRAGLAKVIPSSVAVGSGTGSASTLGTVTFSGVSSLSLNDVFSTTYDNYKIVLNTAQSDAVGLGFRVRVSGSDLTSSTYKWSRYFNFSSNSAYASSASDSSTSIDVPGGIADRGLLIFEVGNPFNAFNTHVQIRSSFINTSSNSYNFTNSGSVNNTTSYTGFTIFPGSGTITGIISVYGYTE